MLRLTKQLLSLSPVFEVFATQIYTHSILSNLTFGGAKYIATGRGFAATRIYFNILFSQFAGPSIYLGMRMLIMLLYVTLTLWISYTCVTLQECCTGIYPSHMYLGFSSCADSIQDRIWKDELLEGDQTDVPLSAQTEFAWVYRKSSKENTSGYSSCSWDINLTA